jgi:chromosome segregation ATPase
MSFAALALMFATLPAVGVRDNWVPYPDGRPGGCYSTPSGLMYSCSRTPKARERGLGDAPAVDGEPGDTAAELREVRRELEALKQRQAELDAQRAAEDARRAAEEAEREAAARPAREAEQRDLDAAMQAYNAIEGAKDSARLRELEAKTEACRKTLEARGYRIMGPGACRAPDASYVNCPEC